MANDSTKMTNPWFEHDENASNDGKILKMTRDFRKLVKTLERSELESLAVLGSKAIFWRIAEFMHGEMLAIDEADVIADDLRIEQKFVDMVLNDFELFRQENGYYVSDRVLRNLERRKEKSKKNSEAVNVRWLLYEFNVAYKEFFDEEPILSSKEIENLKNYTRKIPDLKDKLRDIIYTLSTLKFETDVKFVPCANWLLKDNNLARIINGEFGPLKHKKTKKELKEEQRQQQLQEAELNKPSDFELQIQAISGKAEALEFIKKTLEGKNLVYQRGKLIGIAHLRNLTNKFDITDKEVFEVCQH